MKEGNKKKYRYYRSDFFASLVAFVLFGSGLGVVVLTSGESLPDPVLSDNPPKVGIPKPERIPNPASRQEKLAKIPAPEKVPTDLKPKIRAYDGIVQLPKAVSRKPVVVTRKIPLPSAVSLLPSKPKLASAMSKEVKKSRRKNKKVYRKKKNKKLAKRSRVVRYRKSKDPLSEKKRRAIVFSRKNSISKRKNVPNRKPDIVSIPARLEKYYKKCREEGRLIWSDSDLVCIK